MTYQELLFDEDQILHLYNANHWTAYTKDKDTLFKGIIQSLDTLACYDNDQLVGLIRTVGDGHTMVYILDILVHPDYHRQGIGRTLINKILTKYTHVRQIHLATDNTPEQQAFYEAVGFQQYGDAGLVGYKRK
ncbi:GNAT family N-acetyltransferase [Candidatus Xianfuyuplasma coldseepsis]|uniref:GNAT family N-acetyltransferase n=1 Tax=Candidatus Xianfuyuplasma coldseepsis TaxID=2782163 RepID=A0A7L7KRK4_9MOLU|nr:GNAT family N-acetyltransferase [Xianfuyuplasma coldseepsis]QMS85215.1 GNAT family N-acetyltransferase [Xianfuyuplasma coldseepsis]